MTEKILPYDRSLVPQETGYWCAPASTQTVLNSLGIKVAESVLAREIGTTVNGTDYIGQVVPILNRRAGLKYVIRPRPNDPPTQAQIEQLWSDLVTSIDAGRGIIANIIAPVPNYPRGTRGSVSPAYGGGVVYHYIPLMGYADDGPGGRHVWVADSGFRPFGYWASLAQIASLIAGKGYIVDPTPRPEPELLDGMTADDRAAVLRGFGQMAEQS